MAHVEGIGELEGKKSLSEDILQRISSLNLLVFSVCVKQTLFCNWGILAEN